MTKFKPGIVTNLSGTMGGTSFVNNPYTPHLRLKTNPINRWSPAKETSKVHQSKVTRLWGSLTPKQVCGWKQLAAQLTRVNSAGAVVKVRANDLFKKLNRNLVEIKEQPILIAPEKHLPLQFASVTTLITVTDMQTYQYGVFYDNNPHTLEDIKVIFEPAIPEDNKVIVYASPMLKYGINSTKKHFYKIIAVIDSEFISGTSILPFYLKAYPNYLSGTFKIAFGFKHISRISGFPASTIQFIQIPDTEPEFFTPMSDASNLKPETLSFIPQNLVSEF